jgi:hypothetical protein
MKETTMLDQRLRPHVPSNLWPLRILGAICLLGIAADHLYEYYVDGYSVVPTIGTLFLLNGIGGVTLALALVSPWDRFLPARAARSAVPLVALAGIGLAATSLAGLFISESTPLFGFMEFGYRLVIVLAIVAEAATILVLGALLSVRVMQHSQRGPRPRPAVDQRWPLGSGSGAL